MIPHLCPPTHHAVVFSFSLSLQKLFSASLQFFSTIVPLKISGNFGVPRGRRSELKVFLCHHLGLNSYYVLFLGCNSIISIRGDL